jgi:molybdenum-dependent DNA-binding transcriptional regulator ModE
VTTGLFPYRQTHSGQRPTQPQVRAARDRADDAAVAEMLAEGRSIKSTAAALHMGYKRAWRAYWRICTALGEEV